MQYLSDSPGSLSHESRCGALHLSSLSTYGRRAKADETVLELVTGCKRMKIHLFLESVTLVTVLQAFVPRKQKKAFGAFTEAPDSKTQSRNPPKYYNLYSTSTQKQYLFPQLNVLQQYFLKNCTLVGHSALPLQLLSLQYGFVGTKISLHIIIIAIINGITEYLLSKDLMGPQELYIV